MRRPLLPPRASAIAALLTWWITPSRRVVVLGGLRLEIGDGRVEVHAELPDAPLHRARDFPESNESLPVSGVHLLEGLRHALKTLVELGEHRLQLCAVVGHFGVSLL